MSLTLSPRPGGVLLAALVASAVAAGAPAATARAQGPALASAARPALPPLPARAITVPEGTEFSVVTAEAVSSKTASEGDRVALRVEEAVVVGGATVIARGTAARGVVSSVERAGRMGKGGVLVLRVEGTTAADGQRVPLRASKARTGDDKTGSTVALTVLFGPLGMLKRGKDASYPEGTRITVYTDQAVAVAPPAAAP